MIQKQGNGNVTMGQSHARMLLNWSMAAGSKDSGNSPELEGHQWEEEERAGMELEVRFQICNSWKLSHLEGLQGSQWTGQA